MHKPSVVIGLTGSIGMGKTVLAKQLESLGAKVCHADDVVHRLLARGGKAVEAVRAHFPNAVAADAVNREALGALVFGHPDKLKILEDILHPLVTEEENRFIAEQKRAGARLIVLDIPLLFETEAENRCDIVIVAHAPRFIQKRRVLKRRGMSREKFLKVLARQMPSHEKKKRAHFVVQTGLGRAYSLYRLKTILKKIHAA